jgi:hypothetical protein
LVTVDRNLSSQQNLAATSITVIILQAQSNRLSDLRPLIPKLLAAIESAKSGIATIVTL